MLCFPGDVHLPIAINDVRASIASSAMCPSTSLLGASHMTPRTYAPSEIRIMKLFMAVLLGIGLLSIIHGLAVLLYFGHGLPPRGNEDSTAKTPAMGKSPERKRALSPYVTIVGGVCFVALALAGIVAIRRTVNNGLRDVETVAPGA